MLLSHNQRNFTFSECERLAYISGNTILAELFYDADEFEIQVDGQDELLEKEKEKSFDEGKYEGLGIVSAERIEELESDLESAISKISRMSQVQQKMLEMFSDERMKTIAGRKEIYKIVKNSLIY